MHRSAERHGSGGDVLDEAHLRRSMVLAGSALTLAIAVAGGVWVAATWDRPHRAFLLVLVVIAVLGAVAVRLVPVSVLVRGRPLEPLLLLWSAADIAIVALAAYADGGVRSPAMLLLVLTLIYAALSYPRSHVVAVSLMSIVAVLVVGSAGSGADPAPDPVFVAGLVITLALAGVMCVWQAQLLAQRGAELTRLSNHDSLTGCLNRRGLERHLEVELERSARTGRPVAVVQIDLDHFKQVNDRHGHAAGDALLAWVGQAAPSVLRAGDALGRVGGDEFTVVLHDADATRGAQVAARVAGVLAERVGASVGVASSERDGATAEPMLRRADDRLYEDKRRRRGALATT